MNWIPCSLGWLTLYLISRQEFGTTWLTTLVIGLPPFIFGMTLLPNFFKETWKVPLCLYALSVMGCLWMFAVADWRYLTFLAGLASFHLGEFGFLHGKGNPYDSFVLNNTWMYNVSILGSMLEFNLKPGNPPLHWATFGGLGLMLTGLTLRWLAIFIAGQAFDHQPFVSFEDHRLVTGFPYSMVRHPSYSGFLLWVLGSQLFLANHLGLLVFALVLGLFFWHRIQEEEKFLGKVFGTAYTEYALATPWKLVPFLF